jgi:hypothetical protein
MTDSPPETSNLPSEIQSNSARARSAWDDLLREEQFFLSAPDAFFAAWKRGVSLAGPHLFGSGPKTDLASAQTKWDVCPKVPLIAKAIGPMSPGERLFLAALVSFYNSDDGGRLLQRAGFHGLADLGRLDLSRRSVIAGLLLNYTGW